MAGGHVFCAPRNLCVFLFTYLSFTTLLNVDCSWSIFSTPGKILYTSQQLSMPTIPSEGASKLKSAGSSRSRHNLVKVHLGLTLMLNSTYAMMMICLSKAKFPHSPILHYAYSLLLKENNSANNRLPLGLFALFSRS